MFTKIFNALRTWMGMKVDEAIPAEVEIQQAIEDLKKKHLRLRDAVVKVVAHQKNLEKTVLSRGDEVSALKKQTQTALLLVEKERAAGNEDAAVRAEGVANTLAMQWKAAESLLEQDKNQFAVAAANAKKAEADFRANELKLQEEMARGQKLKGLAKQAKMQKALNEANQVLTEVGTLESSPTLSSVEEKLNERLSEEEAKASLHANSADGLMAEIKQTTMQNEASAALDELRAEMGLTSAAEMPEDASTNEAATEPATEA